jgi:glucose/mannose transport system permease protein
MQDKKEKRIAFLMILPSIIAVGVFVYGFIAWTVRVSFSAWRGMTPDYTFVGLKNYINLFVNNLRFQIDIKNTLIFTAIFVLGCLIIGLLSALLLDQGLKGEGFFRSLFIFPMAISYIVTGVVWRWLMNPAQGSRMSGLNLLFDKLGLDFLISNWTSTPVWGIAFLAIPAIWQLSGYTMAMYLAGLRAIPDELREAARWMVPPNSISSATSSCLFYVRSPFPPWSFWGTCPSRPSTWSLRRWANNLCWICPRCTCGKSPLTVCNMAAVPRSVYCY